MQKAGYNTLRDLFKNIPNTREFNKEAKPILALGPCAFEDNRTVEIIAEKVAAIGATYLRGGAIKLRTRVGSFEGLGPKAWKSMRSIANKFNLKTVSEITDHSDTRYAAKYLDLLQIGARSMWNFKLLKECASTNLPIMLKRGLGATTFDWFCTAERLLSYGCKEIIMCERGLASIDDLSRNSIDFSCLAFLLKESPLPLWIDVSHSAGDPDVALSLFKICHLLGVEGIMAETHNNPTVAKCDAHQAIPLHLF